VSCLGSFWRCFSESSSTRASSQIRAARRHRLTGTHRFVLSSCRPHSSLFPHSSSCPSYIIIVHADSVSLTELTDKTIGVNAGVALRSNLSTRPLLFIKRQCRCIARIFVHLCRSCFIVASNDLSMLKHTAIVGPVPSFAMSISRDPSALVRLFIWVLDSLTLDD
jgi:hypothetical protein